MAEVIYIKYNRTRKEEFQIRTAILEENGRKWVEKSALTDAGIPHIEAFLWKYKGLTKQSSAVRVAEPILSEDGSCARFPYLEGKTLAELLGHKIRDGKAPVKELAEVMDKICQVKDGCLVPFQVTREFGKVFGEFVRLKDVSMTVTNIDMLLENILVTGDGWYAIDYEWVYDFPVPVRFVKYRILFYFYRKYGSLMEYKDLGHFLAQFGISEKEAETYDEMEVRFQHYVHGENQETYMLKYRKNYRQVEELVGVEEEMKEAREQLSHMSELEYELENRDTELSKLKEIQRLTQNHVTNLEIIIGDLRRENGELANTLNVLNRHISLPYRARRKLGVIFNRFFPKGTRKRKIMSYCKNTLIHPVSYMKLYTTEEGRNRIEGDFQIGDDYRIYGKVRFPKEENPTVSIVIPVYNQIHYTYACLRSILEFTKDVSYEVIIADDVSSDATKDLSRYADNLMIMRNETNQGFLKNCNQAAKAARGKYIMFLNNDTQVTEGWLSSLVRLIQSDPSIGMVGSKLVYPDGRLQEAGGIIWSDGSGWNYGRLDDPDKPEYNYVKDVDYISGAAILLPLGLWKQIGGFDERFAPAYCEDSDLAFEVRKAGYRVVYQPLSKVVHFEGVSNGTDVNGTGLKRYQVENSEKLKEKWAEEFKKQCVNDGNPNPFRARERSMGKKIILVVDHYVPTFDKDAGSKTTYQYLKMFIKKGFVVKFLGDNFLHEEPYSTELEQMGIEILYGPEFQSKIWDWLKENGKEISIAYLNRPHIASKYIDFLKKYTDMKIIYYGHDLHFLREGREYALTGNEENKKASDYWRSVELSLMKKADMSYYPSYVERDAIHDIDSRIRVKDITAYVYDEFLENISEDFEKREGLLFVGGFAHPPNADGVLWFAREIYPLIRKRLDAPFYIVGSKVTEEIQALEQPGNGIIVKGFVSEEELARLYSSCRVVVVPLRYGAGIKGKVVEAIYNGAPIVTTSVGAEGMKDIEGIMLVKDTPEEFAAAAADLYEDPEACRKMSQASQAYIRKYFSVDGAWERIKEDFTVKALPSG